MYRVNLKRAMAFLLCFCICFSCFAGVTLAERTAKTNASCKLYKSAKTSSAVVVSLKKGVTVTIEEFLGDNWARATVDKKEGYILRKYLDDGSLTYSIEPCVTTKATKLYRDSSLTSALASIPKGIELSALSTEGEVWYVRYKEVDGYIPADALRLGTLKDDSPNAALSADDVNAKKILKAQKTNEDVIGWVNVPSTNIDEPVLYAPNYYYADHNINKKRGFTSTYSHSGNLTPNIVIFGHNIRKSATVFHGLLHLHLAALGTKRCPNSLCRRSIKSSLGNWYKTKSGRTWNVSIFGMQKWEVFAMYEVPDDEPDSTLRNNYSLAPADMDEWLKGQLARSDIQFNTSVSASDQILTLITCGTNYDAADANSRLFVFLKNVD